MAESISVANQQELSMTEWLAVITITLLAVISPGPDFAMVSRNSLTLSRRAGLVTAFGIGAGVLVHVAYTLLGIGLLLKNSPALFDALKLVGAAYLVWLGIGMLRNSSKSANVASGTAALSDLAALRIGFLTNALNPKTTIFIVSLFLQVVQPQTPLATQIAYGLFISVAHVVWFAVVALFFGAPKIREAITGVRHWIDRAFGTALVGFGIALAVANVMP
ncbi:LysE family translocator [Pannonibacter tanglangensis]|nr:LysE family transporter [Pannonibacter sp. XCT-34]